MIRAVLPVFRFGFVVVRGDSMQPTLFDGDWLLIDRNRQPGPGELVIVRFSDGEVSVKRVDLIEPAGYYVTRDNPRMGRDSWTLGGVPIPTEDLIATVVRRIHPLRRRA
ncbi:MAG TPA: S24 family peptidase [Marmoricola sp.]|nr:S24 family peptidase [Marmoricola sp.]HNJ78190.1 S24 family peptidase [Marmoricola sp.]HNN49297.1 S24 family peptidase [Marmoricola sp.]